MMSELKKLRDEIDKIDEQILHLLANRVNVCEAIGAAKKKQKLSVKDEAREEEVYRRIHSQAAKLGLNPARFVAVYREIVNMCSSVQE
jgi:monofunctional chorismate mutase